MEEKRDIQNRQDLELLLYKFYEKVFRDDLISHFFTEVKQLDLDKHVPRITDFWETILLNGHSYRANAIAPHIEINRLSAIEERHFKRWLQLFGETIDSLFAGEVAETAKQRALSIATVMRIKLSNESQVKLK